MELHGRRAEQAAIAALLDRARDGRSGALLLSGAAGMGKTALLADAAASADGLRVLRATGAEAEAELPFAGLHQLLAPVLDRAAALPRPQAAALERALGVAEGPAPEPLLLGAGVLGLLAEAGPALVLVDDLHWLDGTVLRFCCDVHDLCYEKYGCTSSSWWRVWSSWTCNSCNAGAIWCFAGGGAGRGPFHPYPY